MTKHTFFIFDVESIGLHGEGFAVAGGIADNEGVLSTTFCFACDPDKAQGTQTNRDWIRENVALGVQDVNCENPKEVRQCFWNQWAAAKAVFPEIVMAGECVWPVEAGFLSACVADDPQNREFSGPYPLHEIASFMEAAGMDPMATYERTADELPKHHPLADSKQSARLLFEALSLIDSE